MKKIKMKNYLFTIGVIMFLMGFLGGRLTVGNNSDGGVYAGECIYNNPPAIVDTAGITEKHITAEFQGGTIRCSNVIVVPANDVTVSADDSEEGSSLESVCITCWVLTAVCLALCIGSFFLFQKMFSVRARLDGKGSSKFLENLFSWSASLAVVFGIVAIVLTVFYLGIA